MDEKRKFLLTILLGLAGLFLLITRFCLPVNEDNKKLIVQLRQLKEEVESLEVFRQDELDSMEGKMDRAIDTIEGKIPTEGELKLTEHLTQASMGGNVVFKAITHGEHQEREDYQIIPVDVVIKAPFYDFIRYLAAIEASPLLIGVESLTVRRVAEEPEFLDIKATFSGFKLTHQFPSMSTYLGGENEPLDTSRLDTLLETVRLRDTRSALLELKDYNPFVPIYSIEAPVAQEEVIPPPVDVVEEEVVSLPDEEEEVLVDPLELLDRLTLRGVLNVGEERAALINDTIVKKGEQIEDMHVVEIQDYRVILMYSDENFTLKMGADNEFVKP